MLRNNIETLKSENIKKKDYLEDAGPGVEITLTLILQKIYVKVLQNFCHSQCG
jgi:hypothetical protein